MISILMPIKNGEEFMEESIPSIFNQSYLHWELIIGINGLPSNSSAFQKAVQYQSYYPAGKIKVMEMTTIIGKSRALNEMITVAQGDYIALLDVDDIWLPDKLKIQSAFLDKYDVIGGACVYFKDNPNVVGIQPIIPLGDFTHFNFFEYNPVINSSCLLRKSLAYWNINHQIQGVEDYDLWLRLWKAGKTFYNCSPILVKHRVHSQSAFNSKGNHLKVAGLLQKIKQK